MIICYFVNIYKRKPIFTPYVSHFYQSCTRQMKSTTMTLYIGFSLRLQPLSFTKTLSHKISIMKVVLASK